MYFTGLTKELIQGAEYAVLPGDPQRVVKLAKFLDENAIFLKQNMQHVSFLANLSGRNIIVISSGMGSPAIASSIQELVKLGVKKFIRIGTTGALKESINLGDIVITKAAVKLDGVSYQNAPKGYPAIPSFALTQSFIDGATEAKIPYHLGITLSSDSFWPGQERYDSYSERVLPKFRKSVDEWKELGVTNIEMEASSLFTTCSVLNVEAVNCCGVVVKRTQTETITKDGVLLAEENGKQILKHGLLADFRRKF